jgi:hypothetical protein
MASLNRAAGWYRHARLVVRALDGTGIVSRADEQTALRLVQRAFDVARAQAAVLARDKAADSPAGGRHAKAQARRQAALTEAEGEVKRLERQLSRAPRARRPAVEGALAAAKNRVELGRASLELTTRLRELDASAAGVDDELAQQIEAMQDAAPELRSAAAPDLAVRPPAVTPSGTWALVQRLLALRRARGHLDELVQATASLESGIKADHDAMRATLRPIRARLRVLTEDPIAVGTSVRDSQQEFQHLLERRKLLAEVLLPLREQTALARRAAADLRAWSDGIDRESQQTLHSLGFDLLGVVVALIVVLAGGLLWRLAVVRYVTDVARRRLLLTIRAAVILVAIALVLVFHFTSEIAALVTALGFAAAGIAFALQNVILAIAGYFTMVAPNGIRVGDRVSLQGQFGYVHGEVAEIGFVRIKLRELAGDALEPTGRMVVFPNSVVFTGSFFKDPAPGAASSS